MEDVIRATFPQQGGWASIQQGRTIIDIRTGEVKNPDGTKTTMSRNIEGDTHSLAIRAANNITMALDVEGDGFFDIPAGSWQHIDDEQFHRIILKADSASRIKLHLSSAPKAFALTDSGSQGLLHGPPEVMITTIPAGPATLTTILDLTGKEPIQAFTFQVVSGPLGVYVGYDKDATPADPRVGILQTINKSGVEILNKLTVLPVGAIAAPIIIVGEAWRF